MDVVVIGGGILGMASAYYLCQKGADVTVLEKETIGEGTTTRANGGIRAQFSSPVSAQLSVESIEAWERFETAFETDLSYHRPGYLFLARTAETATQLADNVSAQNKIGIDSELLTPSEAAEKCPGLAAENYHAASYAPGDGFADPHAGLEGFVAAARSAGASIRTQVTVTDVLRDPAGRVTGVQTTSDQITADYVVNAAGPWAPEIGAMAGVSLPITPKRRKLLVAEPATPVDTSVPFTIDQDIGVHFRPKPTGRAVCGGHFANSDPAMDPDDYPESVSTDWSAHVIDELGRVATYFGPDSVVTSSWAGLYSMTPDHHPIIEESVPGFVVVAGFSGHGFMQSPAAGKLVSELVVDGSPSLLDISMLTADRFERGLHLEEGTVIN